MGEVALAHQVVGLECLFDVGVVDSDGHAHQHVLRAFSDFAVELEEVGTLKGLESKVVVGVISAVVNVVVENIGVGHDDLVDFLRNQRSVLVGFRVDVFAKVGDDIGEDVLGRAMEVVNANAGSQATVIGVVGCERRCGFGGELVQLASGHPVVESLDGQLRDVPRIDPRWVEAFRKFDEFFVDGIKSYVFSLAFPVDNLHGHDLILRCSYESVISFFVRVRFKSLRPQKIAVGRFRAMRCP